MKSPTTRAAQVANPRVNKAQSPVHSRHKPYLEESAPRLPRAADRPQGNPNRPTGASGSQREPSRGLQRKSQYLG